MNDTTSDTTHNICTNRSRCYRSPPEPRLSQLQLGLQSRVEFRNKSGATSNEF